MPLNYTPGIITNKVVMGNKKASGLSKTHGTKLIRATTRKGQQSYQVLELYQRLNANKTLSPQLNYNSNQAAKDILNIMGVSCVIDTTINRADYSLIDDQIDFELILNPNKVDFKDLKVLKKGKITFDKIIKNTDDPFYTLDEQISQNYIKQNELILHTEEMDFDFVSVAADLSSVNIYNPSSPTTRTLKRSVL